MTTVFRVRYVGSPGHVYCRIFAADRDTRAGHGAGLGSITVRRSEWDDFRAAFSGAKFFDDLTGKEKTP
jgi:hypothetical protein